MQNFPHIFSHIIIAAATYGEAAALIKRIQKPSALRVGGRETVSGHIAGKPVKILITGQGLVNTVQALTASVENSSPCLIVQTGCAGAFKEAGLKIGDIGIATEEIDTHLGIEPENVNRPLIELPFPVTTRNDLDIKNRYPLDNRLVDQACKSIKNIPGGKDISFKKGPFITVSTITATDKRAERLYKWFAPCMENMEGSGAAHIAIHYGIPFLEVRCASNFVGKRDLDSWNLPLAFERGALAVLAVIHGFG